MKQERFSSFLLQMDIYCKREIVRVRIIFRDFALIAKICTTQKLHQDNGMKADWSKSQKVQFHVHLGDTMEKISLNKNNHVYTTCNFT